VIWLMGAGSVASILALFVSLYVLWREVRIGNEVHTLKTEEEQWHDTKEIRR
jgi:hypothetical protein